MLNRLRESLYISCHAQHCAWQQFGGGGSLVLRSLVRRQSMHTLPSNLRK